MKPRISAAVTAGLLAWLIVLPTVLLVSSLVRPPRSEGPMPPQWTWTSPSNRHGDPTRAAETIEAIPADEVASIPALIEVLGDATHEDVRLAAIHALGRMGPAAAPAARYMVSMSWAFTHPDLSKALLAIGPSAIPALIDGLDSELTLTENLCARVLGTIGAPALDAVAAWVREDSSNVHSIDGDEPRLLEQMGPVTGPIFLDELERLRERPESRAVVAANLWRVCGEDPEVFERALGDLDEPLRTHAWGVVAGQPDSPIRTE